jgi:ureidoacrylate peracid hydrolase
LSRGVQRRTVLHMLEINARPAQIDVDPKRCAVIVVDMQNDFGAAGGMFDRAGIDIEGIVEAAEATSPVLKAARDAGLPVIYLKMEHREDLSDAGPADGPHWIKHLPLNIGSEVVATGGSPSRILVRDTWNTEILDVVKPESGDYVISKQRFSGFFETELDDLLRRLGVRYLLVTGCTTSVCVESTVRDAMFRDYSCIVLEDCTAEPIGAGLPRTNHDASLLVIETLVGWVSNARAACEALSQQAQLV